MAPLAVIAIGGNTLIKDSTHQSLPDQKTAVRETARHIAEMITQGWNIVITHGNGPQVGFILLRSELAQHVLHHTLPLVAYRDQSIHRQSVKILSHAHD
jgi:carbamate kinase